MKIIRSGSRSAIKDPQESPGWKGNVFYPDGPTGHGFGIAILPDGRVWFPMVKEIGEKVQATIQEPSYPLQEPVPKFQEVHRERASAKNSNFGTTRIGNTF